MKIIAFGASSSKQSINKNFAIFAAKQFDTTDIEILDLNDYPLPLFSVDAEKEGVPENASMFYQQIQKADLLIISMAEHNGTYTAAFKNLFDWVSRYKMKMFEGKKILLLSTAPGERGGKSSIDAALLRFPRHGADILEHFSLPNYETNFSPETGICNTDLQKAFNSLIAKVKKEI